MTDKTPQQRVNDRQRNDRRASARRILLHYFDLMFEDRNLSYDCRTEYEGAVNDIFDEMDDLSARLDTMETMFATLTATETEGDLSCNDCPLNTRIRCLAQGITPATCC